MYMNLFNKIKTNEDHLLYVYRSLVLFQIKKFLL